MGSGMLYCRWATSALDCDVEMSVWSLDMSNDALGEKTHIIGHWGGKCSHLRVFENSLHS